MSRRILIALIPVAAGAALVASGALGGGTSAQRAAVLPSSSCGPVFYKGPGSPQFLIASDLPLQGAARAQPLAMVKAIQFVLERQYKFKAGKYTIGYQSCDDATAQAGGWAPEKCTANARAYANDRSVIAVIGTFNSGCAKLVIPILNRAPNGPLGMVSPANTYPGLTHAAKGITEPGEPQRYYPTGKRNYIRMVATDDFQGPADVILIKQLKRKSVYILHDNQTYGKGVALAVQGAAKKLGIKVLGFEAWDAKAASYEAVADRIKQSGAQAVFMGGIVDNNGAKLIKDLRAGLGPNVLLVAPDGFTPFSAVAEAGSAAEGVYISVAGLPNQALGKTGKAFLRAFSAYAKKKTIDPYAVYAAQAAQVTLDAIARSNGTRPSVVAELFKTNVKDGILGTFRIDRNGDTTLKGITIYKMTKGEGAYNRFIVPPAQLVG